MSHYGADACKDSKSLQATKLRLLKKFSKPQGARQLLKALEINLNTVQKTLVSPKNSKLMSSNIFLPKSFKPTKESLESRNKNLELDATKGSIERLTHGSIETAIALNSPKSKGSPKILLQDARPLD